MNNVGGPAPVTPSQFNPKPNGATSTAQTPTPQPATQTATPEPKAATQTQAAPSEVETLRAKLQEAEQREVQEKRTRITERRQWEREKLTFGEKLKLADEYSRLRSEARINKRAVAEKLWGEKWHEELNTEMANGGALSPEAVQAALDERDRRAEEKMKAAQAEQQKAADEARQRRIDAQVRAFTSSAVEFAKTSAKDYPIFEQFKTPERIGGALVQRVRDVHDATTKYDEEGNVVVPGKIISLKEAAELIEKDLLGIARAAVGAEKYRGELTPERASGTVSGVAAAQQPQSSQSPPSQSQQQGRNDMTGSTRPNAPILTDEERRQAAIKKYYEALAARGTS
jgi:hypothetical protein